MARLPLLGLEKVEVFACSAMAAIVVAGRLAAAARAAPPIRNRRRGREGTACGAMAASSSVGGFIVDILDLHGGRNFKAIGECAVDLLNSHQLDPVAPD